MSGQVPKDPSWCSYCIAPEEYGARQSPCNDHRGPDGKPQEFTRTYECFGYDRRHGFWMRTVDDIGPLRQTNISERAIDRTFHRVDLSLGAEMLLKIIDRLGRMPSQEEREGVILNMASPTLEHLGLINKAGEVTPFGRTCLDTDNFPGIRRL